MSLLDFILNLTGLLLWLSWCSRRLDPLERTTPATLIGTVKRAEPRPFKGWYWLAALLALLLARALFYDQVGSAVGWTPKLNLGCVVLAFRSDQFVPLLLYSGLSFARILAVYYFWLLALVLINWSAAEPDPLQRLLRLHLGWAGRLPWPLAMLLPVACVALLWVAVHPLLQQMAVVTSSKSMAQVLEQSLLLTLTLTLSLKYLLPALLLAHIVGSYVYLGASPLWNYIACTSRNLLKPLKSLPLRAGKVDFAPLMGAILLVVLLHWAPRFIQMELGRRNVAVWPQ